VGKFATFNERPKAKSVSASGSRPGALLLDPAGGFALRPPVGGLTLVFGGASNCLTPALIVVCFLYFSDIYRSYLLLSVVLSFCFVLLSVHFVDALLTRPVKQRSKLVGQQ